MPNLATARFDVYVLVPTHGAHYAIAVYRDNQAFVDAERAELSWRGEPLELACSPTPLPPRQTLIRINGMLAYTKLQDFFNFFEWDLRSHVEVIPVWVTYSKYSWNTGRCPCPGAVALPKTAFAGTVLVLAQYKQGRCPGGLPGFISYKGHELHLHDRCSSCKLAAKSVHRHDDCRWKVCYRCRARGHVQAKCPCADQGEPSEPDGRSRA